MLRAFALDICLKKVHLILVDVIDSCTVSESSSTFFNLSTQSLTSVLNRSNVDSSLLNNPNLLEYVEANNEVMQMIKDQKKTDKDTADDNDTQKNSKILFYDCIKCFNQKVCSFFNSSRSNSCISHSRPRAQKNAIKIHLKRVQNKDKNAQHSMKDSL
jgi:hypothetical protein